jgi:hypothetical protein
MITQKTPTLKNSQNTELQLSVLLPNEWKQILLRWELNVKQRKFYSINLNCFQNHIYSDRLTNLITNFSYLTAEVYMIVGSKDSLTKIYMF